MSKIEELKQKTKPKKTLSVRLPGEEIQRLKQFCEQNGFPPGEFVAALVVDFLDGKLVAHQA